jgi:hypothetical protein
MNAMLKHISEAATPDIMETDVKKGAVVVYQPGNHWAIEIARQHKRRLRHGLRLVVDPTYVSTHYRSTHLIWANVAGDGYCGYETL